MTVYASVARVSHFSGLIAIQTPLIIAVAAPNLLVGLIPPAAGSHSPFHVLDSFVHSGTSNSCSQIFTLALFSGIDSS